jgi:hypothetical protein
MRQREWFSRQSERAAQARCIRACRDRMLNLVVACEFWAAAMNRILPRHLAGSAFIHLRAAEESFAGIHACGARAAVRLARLRLRVSGTPTPLRDIAEQLEAELAVLKEPVDDFINDFACQHVRPRSIAGSDIGP